MSFAIFLKINSGEPHITARTMPVNRSITLGLSIALISGISVSRKASGATAFGRPGMTAFQSGTLVVDYKTVLSTRIAKDNNRLVILIAIAPANFTRESMIALGSQLKTDFANEPLIRAVIFESKTAAHNYNPAGGSYFESVNLE